MKIHFLCILALCALPSVLAISCYLCVPDPTNKFCMSNVTNITDCDSLGDLPKGTYDACMKTSMILDMGGQDISMNSMTCMVKSGCENATKAACTPQSPQMKIKKCDSNCCYTDKCSGLEAGGGTISPTGAANATVSMSVPVSPTKAPQTTTGPAGYACTQVASSVVVFFSVTVIFAGFFKH